MTDCSDVQLACQQIGCQSWSAVVRIAWFWDSANKGHGEWSHMQLEIKSGSDILDVCKRLLVIRPKWMIDIWRQLLKGQVRQSFIKLSMSCNFHLVSLAVTPQKAAGHFCAIDQNLAGRRPSCLTHTLQPNVFGRVQSSFWLVVISIGLAF